MARLHIGSDHAAIDLRHELAAAAIADGHTVLSESGPNESGDSVDYPDIAAQVCERVHADPGTLGLLLCGTGQGVAIAANKHAGIRAAVVLDGFSARMAREHNDANVLCLGARVCGPGLARMLLQTFLAAEFAGGRHARRVAKIDASGASGMLCPVCRGANIKVLDSRDSRDGVAIRRRRACSDCAHRFTTYERIETSLPVVVKRNGGKQAFDRLKLLAGLKLACRKRPIEDEQLETIVAAVELWAATRGEREIQAEEIGERVMQHLHVLDPVAYVRFVSVYRSFDSVQAFSHLLNEMEKAAQANPEGQRTLFEIDARGHIQLTPRPEDAEPPPEPAGEPGEPGDGP